MATQVKKKHMPKGVRLGWTPKEEVQRVKLVPELLKGERIDQHRDNDKTSSGSESSFSFP